MQQLFKFILAVLTTIGLGSCSNSETTAELESLFTKRGITGTLLISNLDGNHTYHAFPERLTKPFLPASTFKIPNTLIAMEEGVISSPDEILKWDGKVRFVKSWNQDHSLRTAFPVSCVWYYQELARRIGHEKYLEHLQQQKYGNMLTGPDVATFWLDGDLRITAEEQIEFLKKLFKNELPYRAEHIRLVKDIMLFDQGDDYSLHAKTGWAIRGDGQHGWWVGYVEKSDEVWFFTINIEITVDEDHRYLKEITKEALGRIGIIPTKS